MLFAWSFLAATILPLGSEVSLAMVVRDQQGVMFPVLVATAGNSLGAFTTLARVAVVRLGIVPLTA